MISRPQLLALLVTAAAALPLSGASLDQTLAKMDQAAKGFKGLSANIQTLHHTEVIHEDDTQSGTILVKRSGHSLRVKVTIESPEKKIAVTDGKRFQVYYPASAEKEEMDIGQKRSLIDMILALGFGGSSKELQADYDIKLGGTETVAGETATRLELVPKSQDMLDQWKKIDLWISDKTGYAVQQKFYEVAKDYSLIAYTNVQPRADLPDSDFALNVPKGVKTEPLNKKK